MTEDKKEMKQKCECWAKISDSDSRADIWRQITPDLKIPLKHPMPVNLDGPEGPMRFYEGDPERLTNEQHISIAEAMESKFGYRRDLVLQDLRNGNLPIKEDNVTVFWCALHTRLAL